MIRANRPWRVAARLYRALVAALAATAFALVTSDIWRIADALGVERLAALAVLALAATTVSLIGVHGLWERAPDRSARDQVALFNAATAITVLIGLTTLYAALFALALGAAALLLPAGVLGDAVGGDASAGTYVRLAWFVSSLAMVGGALGAGLESGDDVREAAYGAREDAPDGMA